MRATSLIAILILVSSVHAGTIAPVVYTHTASGAKVYVACYWWEQAPDRIAADGAHLLFVCPRAYWQTFTKSQRNAIREQLDKLLSGEIELSRGRLSTWKNAIANVGVTAELVLPGQAPAVGNKLFVVVVGRGESPVARLISFGLSQPEDSP